MKRFLLGLAMVCATATSGAAAEKAPADVVKTFHAALLDAMQKGETVACTQRIARLAPVIRSTFEIPEIARLALRKHWKEISPEQQRQFVESFEDLIITTYASQFRAYDGESFTAPVAEGLPGGRQEVHSGITHAGDPPVSFDYVLQSSPGGWRVINVIANGVSDLALRSAQYDSVIRKQGFDQLVTGLHDQAAKNRESC